MSGSNSDNNPKNPGGIQPDPDGAPARQPFSVDDALAALQQRRRQATARPTGRPPERDETQDPPRGNGHALAHQEPNDGLPPPPDPGHDDAHYGDDAAGVVDETGGEPDPRDDDDHGGDETYFTVQVGDQQRQVSLSELTNGYMRAADYTKKSSETAAQQKQFADAFKAFSDMRGELEARLARFVPEAAKEFAQPIDWVKLAQTNPMEWAEKRARYDALKEAETEQQRLAGLRQQEEFARKQEQLRIGNDYLMRAIPEWRDPAKKTQLQAELKDFARSVGYSDQELNGEILDPRYIVVFNDAMKYRRMQSRRVNVPPKQEPARQPLGRGGQPQAPGPSRRQQAVIDQFAGAPTVDNALALLKSRHKLN